MMHDKRLARRTNSNGLVLAYVVAAALALLAWPELARGEEQLTVESRQQKDATASENELADTINYLQNLEKLDKYWSEVARPRFGRSEYKQPLGLRFASVPGQAQGSALMARQVKLMNEPRAGLLIDLINARLAQRYNSNHAY